jgi:inorganic phosphate transporter, PiT family
VSNDQNVDIAPMIVLGMVIITSLAFDFTNGFHDTANAMATSIATGALKPKTAVALSAVLNLVGAFLSVQVALTVTNSVIKIQDSSGAPNPQLTANGGTALLLIVLAGLVGAIVWNLLTWLLGLPSSSSHALFGGLIGATIAGLGVSSVKWVGTDGKLDGVVGKVILPALLSPLIASVVAMTGTWLIYRMTRAVAEKFRNDGFRWGQIGSASLISLAHGMNDAQKTMGIITLALIASGQWHDLHGVPLWVKAACATAIALGTFIGGWRIIRTLGKGLVEIDSPQGLAADSASAATIIVSSHLGFALSTTHVATGSIIGTGLGRKGAQVRWAVAARMLVAWLITLPSAGLLAALAWAIGNLVGGLAGAVAIFVILVACALYMFWHSRKNPVGHHNVTDEWEAAPDRVVTDTVKEGVR